MERSGYALAGYLLACKAQQALERGDTAKAVALAEEAQSGKWALTPAVEAFAAMFEARAWATDGKAENCERKLDDAARLFAKGIERGRADEPPWIYFFDEGELAAAQASCYARLGHTDTAIAAYDDAITNLHNEHVRDRAWYRFRSAEAYAYGNDPEQAATVARDAVQTLIDSGSHRVLDRARKLHARLEHAKSTPAVREFGELLQTS